MSAGNLTLIHPFCGTSLESWKRMEPADRNPLSATITSISASFTDPGETQVKFDTSTESISSWLLVHVRTVRASKGPARGGSTIPGTSTFSLLPAATPPGLFRSRTERTGRAVLEETWRRWKKMLRPEVLTQTSDRCSWGMTPTPSGISRLRLPPAGRELKRSNLRWSEEIAPATLGVRAASTLLRKLGRMSNVCEKQSTARLVDPACREVQRCRLIVSLKGLSLMCRR
mmetsp:Transcript_2333/g.5453  ORF Transcript_2333/g.5453 Transcript_2333/m.5453 type:complete len:229 (-) Transcript_2333:23-709(-)